MGIDQDNYRKLFRTFKELCKNKAEKLRHDSMYFISASSYHDNFKLVFGYENPILKDRFHDVLAGGVKEKSLFFSEYLTVMHPFIFGTEEDQAELIFKIYDSLNDGTLDGEEIVKHLQSVPPSSVIATELNKLQTYYVDTKLRAPIENPFYVFDLKSFMSII